MKIRIPKNCILCEEWVLFKVPLCRFCRSSLYLHSNKIKKLTQVEGVPLVYLWDWTSDNSKFLQKLIVSMKDAHNERLYSLFMGWLNHKMKDINKINKVMAIPSFDRSHPELMSQTYVGINQNAEIYRIRKLSSSPQKARTREERLRVQFETGKNQNSLQKSDRLIVLDDVLSSGGSAKSAIRLAFPAQVKCIAVWAYKAPKPF